MMCKPFQRTFDIEMPVSKTVEAARHDRPIIESACQLEGLLVVFTAAFVVASSPQHAEVQQRLPLVVALSRRTRYLEGRFIVSACLVKFADKFVSLSAPPEQA